MSLLRSIWHSCVPEHVRNRIYRMRVASNPSVPLILEPTYADDGLISQHICDFMQDEAFLSAYAKARHGLDWKHPGEIQYRAYIVCWAARHALTLQGDFVECGVAHGIYSLTLCDYLNFASVPKKLFLFDTFRGVPLRDLTDQNEIQLANWFNTSHYAEDLLPLARERFGRYPNVSIVPGILPDTLSAAPLDKVAYLSIDMNNAPAEIGSITYLWDKLVAGAVVVLDDYAYGEAFRNQKQAWDAFAREKNFSILTLPTGQGLFFKSTPTAH